MNKSANVTVELGDDAYAAFKEAPEIVLKAGIRVPTSQLVQTIINAEMSRLNSRKIAQRFLKCILQQVGGLSGTVLDDEDEQMPEIPSAAAAAKPDFLVK
jgi:hypothetical protein